MEIDDDLGQKIQELLPKCLDDIVRIHREKLAIRLATDEEVMALHHEITPSRSPETMLDDWRLVAFVKSFDGSQHLDISLLGELPYDGSRITSPVRKLDLDRGLAITRSGTLYGLGRHGEGEPLFGQLATVCAAAHAWGWGALFGVPHFFF
jgi:hypothetical protein